MKKLLKYNNRKGVFSHIQLAILALVAIIIFSLFLYKAYVNISEKMGVQSCKNSIAAHSLVATGSFSEIFTDIKCPTREITIKNPNKAYEIIAEDMHRCWYIWDQGEGQYFKGDGNFCHICSVYQFGDKGQEVKGLINYLANNDVKVKYVGEVPGIKYIDYFQGYSSPNADRKVDADIQGLTDIDVIDTSQRYATIFVYASGKDAIDKMLEGGKRATAVTGLALFGTAGTTGALAVGHVGMAAATASMVASAGTVAAGTATGTGLATTTITIFSATGEAVSTVATIATTGGYATTAGGILVPLSSAAGTAAVEAGAAAAGGAVAGGAAAGSAVLGITPVGWVAIGIGVLALTGYGVYTLLDVPDPEWIAYIAFRPYNADELKALNCEQLAVNQMSNVGR
jgi:hypothetical protein